MANIYLASEVSSSSRLANNETRTPRSDHKPYWIGDVWLMMPMKYLTTGKTRLEIQGFSRLVAVSSDISIISTTAEEMQ